jgi:ABC-type polysaccharide transport system permease subunit
MSNGKTACSGQVIVDQRKERRISVLNSPNLQDRVRFMQVWSGHHWQGILFCAEIAACERYSFTE